MSVGKMNQLYANQGFLTPEKRCSKGPARYRYPKPKTYKVLSSSYHTSELFPIHHPQSENPLLPRPPNTYTYNLIYPKIQIPAFDSPDLTASIDSALSLIQASKARRIENNVKRSCDTRSYVNKNLERIKGDVLAITQLSQEMEELKSLLLNYS